MGFLEVKALFGIGESVCAWAGLQFGGFGDYSYFLPSFLYTPLLFQTVSHIRRQLESTGISSTIISATFLGRGLPVSMAESGVFHILTSLFGSKSCFLITYSSFRKVALDPARMVTVVSVGRSMDSGEFAVACFGSREHKH